MLFVLLAGAVALQDRHPAAIGTLIGLAISMKIYPLLLLVGLLVARRYRSAAAAVIATLIVAGIAELILGVGTTRTWIAISSWNAQVWADTPSSLSFVRPLQQIVPGVSPNLLSPMVFSVLLAGMLLLSYRTRAWHKAIIPLLLGLPLT